VAASLANVPEGDSRTDVPETTSALWNNKYGGCYPTVIITLECPYADNLVNGMQRWLPRPPGNRGSKPEFKDGEWFLVAADKLHPWSSSRNRVLGMCRVLHRLPNLDAVMERPGGEEQALAMFARDAERTCFYEVGQYVAFPVDTDLRPKEIDRTAVSDRRQKGIVCRLIGARVDDVQQAVAAVAYHPGVTVSTWTDTVEPAPYNNKRTAGGIVGQLGLSMTLDLEHRTMEAGASKVGEGGQGAVFLVSVPLFSTTGGVRMASTIRAVAKTPHTHAEGEVSNEYGALCTLNGLQVTCVPTVYGRGAKAGVVPQEAGEMIMEALGSLSECVVGGAVSDRRHVPFAVRLLWFAEQGQRALDACAKVGYAHADVKPANMCVRAAKGALPGTVTLADTELVLIDWGLACERQKRGNTLATRAYRAVDWDSKAFDWNVGQADTFALWMSCQRLLMDWVKGRVGSTHGQKITKMWKWLTNNADDRVKRCRKFNKARKTTHDKQWLQWWQSHGQKHCVHEDVHAGCEVVQAEARKHPELITALCDIDERLGSRMEPRL
jgi:hypothetical protein